MATQEEIDAIRTQLIADATSGVKSVTVDGQTTTLDDLKARLAILDRLNPAVSTSPKFGLRFTKLIPPGAG